MKWLIHFFLNSKLIDYSVENYFFYNLKINSFKKSIVSEIINFFFFKLKINSIKNNIKNQFSTK